MGDLHTIRERMIEAATATLGELHDVEHIDDRTASALAALVGSRIASRMIKAGHFSLETLPVPPMSRQFEVQLDVLWTRCQAADADRDAILGAVDRIVAELYELSLTDLMTLELAIASSP